MSTTTVAPADAAAFLQQFQIKGLTAKQQDDVHNAITEYLGQLSAANEVYADFQNIRESGGVIEAGFNQVYISVLLVENRGVIVRDGKAIQFAPDWKILHDEYVGLMNRSQASAAKLNAKILALFTLFLPASGQNSPVGKNRKSLIEYIEKLADFEQEAIVNRNLLLKLRESVTRFHWKFKDTVTHQIADVEAQLNQFLTHNGNFTQFRWKIDDTITSQIANAEAQLERLSESIEKLVAVHQSIMAAGSYLGEHLRSLDLAAAEADDEDDDMYYHINVQYAKPAYFFLRGALDCYTFAASPST